MMKSKTHSASLAILIVMPLADQLAFRLLTIAGF